MDLQGWLRHTNTSVKSFAAAVGVDQATVRRWLNGTRKPSLATLQRVVRETKGEVGIDAFVVDRHAVFDERPSAA